VKTNHRRAAGHRHARLEALLYEELSALIRSETSDPRLEDVEVAHLVLSADGRNLTVWIAGADQDALAAATGFVRARLAERVPQKRMPELRLAPWPG
jgi:ribosome-binding factor A